MANIQNPEAIRAALADVLKPQSFNGWVLLNYPGNHDTNVALEAKGNGGVAELVPHLKNNEVQYALVRLHEKKGTTDTSKGLYYSLVSNVKCSY